MTIPLCDSGMRGSFDQTSQIATQTRRIESGRVTQYDKPVGVDQRHRQPIQRARLRDLAAQLRRIAHHKQIAKTRCRFGKLAEPQYVQTIGMPALGARSEEHTSELPSLMRISYAVFCLKKKKH